LLIDYTSKVVKTFADFIDFKHFAKGELLQDLQP